MAEENGQAQGGAGGSDAGGGAGVAEPKTLLAKGGDGDKGADAAKAAADAKAAEAKAAADAAAKKSADDASKGGKADDKPALPEKYEFKLPADAADMSLNEARLGEISAVAKELGLSQEQFDKVAPIAVGLVKDALDAQQKALWERNDQWVAAVQKDNDIAGIGGADLAKNLALAKKGFETFAAAAGAPAEEIAEVLGNPSLGSRPWFLKLAMQLGKLATDDSFDLKSGSFSAARRASGDPMQQREDLADRLYGGKKE